MSLYRKTFSVQNDYRFSKQKQMVKSSVEVVTRIGNYTIQGNFAIDNTTGKDTTITFNYMYMYMSQQPCLVEIRLQKPDGSVIDKNDTENYQANNESQIIQIDIPGIALEGEWNYTIFCPCNTSVLVNVLSKPIGDKEAIRVQPWFGDKNSSLESNPGAEKSIYAKVSQGYTPVIGLKVTGVIEGSTKEGFKTIYVDLQDNGIATDLLANDGIYSAKFGRFVVNDEGRYSVTIQVDNPNNTAKIAKYSYIMVSGAASIGTEPVKPIATYQAVGPIQRVSAAGELRVERPDYAIPVDVIPPPRIRDLQLVRLDIEEAKVTLKWTAVGDDVSHSSNTKYDLRLGTFEEVSERFENSSQIHLPVTPRKAGEGEEQEIDMADYNKTATYFLAIRAIDAAGNKGDPSNIISLSMTLPTRFSNGDPIVTKLPKLPRAVTPPLQMMIILACVGAGAVILMSVNVGVVYYYKKRRNLKTTPAGMAGEQRDVINAEKGGSAANSPQADQKGQEAPIYHVGQEGIAPRPSAYDNMGFGKVANLVKQFEVL
ncbi:calcium-activated chloride channel regulator 4A-like [Lineus longissimus]|uniref:calcium-activated chloride channel regulator 4A-like n=1 Tax=Lineus longissimus TaxID=88925 RepID=UPI00315C5CD5